MGGKCGGDGSSGDPDQAVEDKAKNKSTMLFSSRASGGGYSDIIEDIGVAYALVGVSLSVIVVVDIAGVLKGSNDSMENGRNRRVGCWRFWEIILVPSSRDQSNRQIHILMSYSTISKSF